LVWSIQLRALVTYFTHIASTTGVGVDKPRSTDIVGLLDQSEVSMPILFDELDGEANARHPSSDDENICVNRHGVKYANGNSVKKEIDKKKGNMVNL